MLEYRQASAEGPKHIYRGTQVMFLVYITLLQIYLSWPTSHLVPTRPCSLSLIYYSTRLLIVPYLDTFIIRVHYLYDAVILVDLRRLPLSRATTET